MNYYKKPPNLTYTDMCIYVDTHVYTQDCDDNLIFEYLYHIAKMLAVKKCLFKDSKLYDDFAIYAASKLLMRYRLKGDVALNGKHVQEIKSVLNYLKNILYPLNVDFEQEMFTENISKPLKEYYKESLHDFMVKTVDMIDRIEFEQHLETLSYTINRYIKKLPYAADKKTLLNIHVSCILSILKSIKLKTDETEKIQKLIASGRFTDYKLNKIFESKRKDCIILFHLDTSWYDYIAVIVRKLQHELSQDLSRLCRTYVSSDTFFTNNILKDKEY